MSGPNEVIGGIEVIGAREVMGVIAVMGVIDVIAVMEVIWFMEWEAMGFEAIWLVVIDDMLAMEGRELPMGWSGRPPFVGSSTISLRLLYGSPLYLAAVGRWRQNNRTN